MRRLILGFCVVATTVCSWGFLPVDAGTGVTTTFQGRLDTVACALACGICCSDVGVLTEENGGFTAPVGGSSLDLAAFLDDGAVHRFSGNFFTGTGLCGQGSCTLFFVSSVDDVEDMTPTFDTTTQRLTVPYVLVDGGSSYSVALDPPFNLTAASLLREVTKVPQFGDCSGPEKRCMEGTSCLSYFGIAGGLIEFKECHIPCNDSSQCPEGQSCLFIVDGPGQVCWN